MSILLDGLIKCHQGEIVNGACRKNAQWRAWRFFRQCSISLLFQRFTAMTLPPATWRSLAGFIFGLKEVEDAALGAGASRSGCLAPSRHMVAARSSWPGGSRPSPDESTPLPLARHVDFGKMLPSRRNVMSAAEFIEIVTRSMMPIDTDYVGEDFRSNPELPPLASPTAIQASRTA
jgi:hypothetical protein